MQLIGMLVQVFGDICTYVSERSNHWYFYEIIVLFFLKFGIWHTYYIGILFLKMQTHTYVCIVHLCLKLLHKALLFYFKSREMKTSA